VERPVPHGDVAAAHVMASKLGLAALLGPACAERDIAYALVPVAGSAAPKPKLAAPWWAGGDTTLSADLGVANAGTDQVYAAMDWLVSRQRESEKKLAARHLAPGGIAMFDVSSSWVEGASASWPGSGAPFGREHLRPRIVQDRHHPGPRRLRNRATDHGRGRGMITGARIDDLRKLHCMGWITALKAPANAALAKDDGPLQMSLLDTSPRSLTPIIPANG